MTPAVPGRGPAPTNPPPQRPTLSKAEVRPYRSDVMECCSLVLMPITPPRQVNDTTICPIHGMTRVVAAGVYTVDTSPPPSADPLINEDEWAATVWAREKHEQFDREEFDRRRLEAMRIQRQHLESIRERTRNLDPPPPIMRATPLDRPPIDRPRDPDVSGHGHLFLAEQWPGWRARRCRRCNPPIPPVHLAADVLTHLEATLLGEGGNQWIEKTRADLDNAVAHSHQIFDLDA